jgi:hypothetical protein
MVAAINKWRKDKPQEAGELWESIIALNKHVAATMHSLSLSAASKAHFSKSSM